MNNKNTILIVTIYAFLLTGCGGGGGSSDSTASLVNLQAGSCTAETQKTWVRAHLNDVYLWYGSIVEVDPNLYSSASDYFYALLVRSQDRFSYEMSQTTADNYYQAGQEVGFGVRWGFDSNSRLLAFYVAPNSPAAGIVARGTQVISVNGTPAAQVSDTALNEALLPSQTGVATQLTIKKTPSSLNQNITLISNIYTSTPVSQPLTFSRPSGKKIGYLLFNSHISTAEQQLISAMQGFKQQGVTEVILDMRYNGGGYTYIAEEIASMIGGAAVQGKVFMKLLFNDKHPELTNDPQYTLRFVNGDTNSALLPQLGLQRLLVITGSSTCSASEAIINSLTPFIPVVRIGNTTCGKPYGMRQTNNCQQAYFAIQFEGVNNLGQDNYQSGFSPTCMVADDLGHALGDFAESRLNAAIYYIDNNICPVGTGKTIAKSLLLPDLDNEDIKFISTLPAANIVQ
ncbi:MAG TPA: S41 family peptidase [Desulfuromonadaceae bacterium]|jgi:C-terminal processing protease CtpA/Prc